MRLKLKLKDSILLRLKSLGLNSKYIPYQQPECSCICLKTRKPIKITSDGTLTGTEIDLYDNKTLRVWTGQIKKANRYAKLYNLKIDLMDRECELYIPISLADQLLPKFGVKVKSKKQLAHLARIRPKFV